MIDTIYIDNTKKKIILPSSGDYNFIIEKEVKSPLTLIINPNLNVNIKETYYFNQEIIWHKTVLENSQVKTSVYSNDKKNKLDYQEMVDLQKDSFYESSVIVLGNKINTNRQINLNGQASATTLETRSLANYDSSHNHSINIYHNNTYTNSNVSNYGVTLDESSISFNVQTEIIKGMKKSEAYQTSKILVFNDSSKSTLNPILRVDEADVKASHAASFGRITPLELYYLQSRGLFEDEAKIMYLKGFLTQHLLEEDKEELDSYIERRFLDVSR